MNNCYLKCQNLKTQTDSCKVSTMNELNRKTSVLWLITVMSSHCFPVFRWRSSHCPRSCCGHKALALSPTFFIWPSCRCSELTTAVLPPASRRRYLTATRYSRWQVAASLRQERGNASLWFTASLSRAVICRSELSHSLKCLQHGFTWIYTFLVFQTCMYAATDDMTLNILCYWNYKVRKLSHPEVEKCKPTKLH